MPIYEYECRRCSRRMEIMRRLSDPPLTECPECGGELRKLISAPAFQFKGSGWYVTDYGKGGKGGKEGKEAGGSKEGDGGKESEGGKAAGGGKSGESSKSGDSKPAEAAKGGDGKSDSAPAKESASPAPPSKS